MVAPTGSPTVNTLTGTDLTTFLSEVDRFQHSTGSTAGSDLTTFLNDVNAFLNGGSATTPPSTNPSTPSSTATAEKAGFSGHGSINGDPHYAWTANGTTSGSSGTEKKWDHQGVADHYYEVLKDNGIEVIDKYGKYSDNANVVTKTGIAFNGNQLEVDAGGHVELNGKTLTDGTYLNGQVTVDHGTVEVKADNYDIKIHDQHDHLDTDFTADNAGSASDKPTGILGSAISNPSANVNGDSFEVKGLFDASKATPGTKVDSAQFSAFLNDLRTTVAHELDLIDNQLAMIDSGSDNSDDSNPSSSPTGTSSTSGSGSAVG